MSAHVLWSLFKRVGEICNELNKTYEGHPINSENFLIL